MEEAQKTVKKNKGAITLVAAIVIALGVGFFGGMQYQKNQRLAGFGNMQQNGNLPNGNTQQNGSGRTDTRGNGNGNQPVSGEITAVDSGSITVKTQDGGSKIVIISDSTKVNVASEGSISDLKTGDTVMVIGTTATDGTVTAQGISVGGLNLQQGLGPRGN